jgi:hypothetical protein
MPGAPCSNRDLVAFLKLMEQEPDVAAEHVRAIGGRVVRAKIIKPFQVKAPQATIWTDEWQVSFFLPSSYPNHPVLDRSNPTTHIDGVRFRGDDEAFTRDLIFAKMLS